ncbi:type VI secretion system baseplate subunit TssG [Sphingomonas deserti]|uniref:Type VI secretion system baseplate subunit TssG n=2 Tax=Allosphingosinicella deserti TaxID=2116704 RepID=A0A2P7QG59_9SPHN|nr:type VI secretion system baseplate subunit TssG [Sphingomonas deserti]
MFPAVRGAEARAPELPRVGRARRPSQSIVDLAQVPAMHFPAPTLESVEFRNGRPQLNGYWLGLTGPQGALPIHLTEFATFEHRYAKKRPFGRWLDVLANRMLQFFFRAWGDSQPVVHADRPDDDRFAGYLAALSGAAEGVSDRALFPKRARVYYAALFASRRSAIAIEDALSQLLGQPVRIHQFQPRWREIPVDDRSRLGRSFARLGDDLVLGSRIRTASDAFSVVIRARSADEFERLLPTSERFAIASEALEAFAPGHLEWDIRLELEEQLVPPARLDGRTRLGWTGWLSPQKTSRIRSDAHLRRIRIAHGAPGELQ